VIFADLGIYGWEERDENLVLASLVTGDPLLLIGSHGCAKTYLASQIAGALNKKFIVYDASKAMFEDVLGYPNVEKLKQGIMEYVPGGVTIWDKEIILIDEIGRAVLELQNKWLEIIRSRRIMGFETCVKWVWAAMNPLSYSGSQTLDEALIGRFSLFLFPPDVLGMCEDDRIAVTRHINGEDAPAIREWLPGNNCGTVSKEIVDGVGEKLKKMLYRAALHFYRFRNEMETLPEFLAKFAGLLAAETKGGISLDGRRLGFIYRNLLAFRAVEIAKCELFDLKPDPFADSARYVVQSSIPVGFGEESGGREKLIIS